MGKNKNKVQTQAAAAATAAVVAEAKDVKETNETADQELLNTFLQNNESVENAKKKILELENKQKEEDAIHMIGISEYTGYRMLYAVRKARKNSDAMKTALLRVSATRDYALAREASEDYSSKEEYKKQFEALKTKYPKGMIRTNFTEEINKIFNDTRKVQSEINDEYVNNCNVAKERLERLNIWDWSYDIRMSSIGL